MVEGVSSSAIKISSSEPQLPRQFARYMLLKRIARGGMGDVYLASTTGIEGAERPCVVKTVRGDHADDASFLARFLDEARVHAQLDHPGVVQLFEAAFEQGDSGGAAPYTVFEYIAGGSLTDVRRRSHQVGARVGWPEGVAIGLEVAQALGHVHARTSCDGAPLGIVHRDLSPQNVMVSHSGAVKLIDFGTAQAENRRCHTVAGVVFAKPGYVAPEVARQQQGDGRVDLYALGVILWELCAGRRMVVGDPQEHLAKVAAGDLVLPAIAREIGAPPLLDAVLGKLAHPDLDARYETGLLAAADLADLLAMAPLGRGGQRNARARLAAAMHSLWPGEPDQSRAEFIRLANAARERAPSPSTSHRGLPRQAGEANAFERTPYILVRTLAEGGTSRVFEVEHTELGRRFALKVLTLPLSESPRVTEHLRRDVRALAELSHPHIVEICDFGRLRDGRLFVAMELLRGETLEARLQRVGSLEWRVAMRFGIELADALDAAHAAGVLHGDIKPANIVILADGSLKVVDFGATAERDSADDRASDAGFVVFGTPGYMAPEQATGGAVDHRCDLYALGCVLFEMVTGSRAFAGRSSVELLNRQRNEAPPRMRAFRRAREVPVEFEALVTQLIDKAPEQRVQSGREVSSALRRILAASGAPRTGRIGATFLNKSLARFFE